MLTIAAPAVDRALTFPFLVETLREAFRAGATKEAGDIVQPLRSGVLLPDGIVADLHELARGKARGRETDDEITLFKSVGAALEDLAAGIAVYRAVCS